MKGFRRIEIKAFRHSITLVSGGLSTRSADKTAASFCIRNAETLESIEADSVEGRRIITEAIDLLRNYLNVTPR